MLHIKSLPTAIVAGYLATSMLAPAAITLLNGATESRTVGFTGFLDNTTADTVAWGFGKISDHTLNSSGALSQVTVHAVTTTGASAPGAGTAPAISITSTQAVNTFDLNSYNFGSGGTAPPASWYTGSDLGERNALANDGGGIYSANGIMTVTIPIGDSVVAGQTYHIELLAFAGGTGLTNPRIMDVSANGNAYVTNWDLREGWGATSNYNSLLEFDVVADANGISIQVDGGTDTGDKTPYIHALSLSSIPEPSVALLGALGTLSLLRRRR